MLAVLHQLFIFLLFPLLLHLLQHQADVEVAVVQLVTALVFVPLLHCLAVLTAEWSLRWEELVLVYAVIALHHRAVRLSFDEGPADSISDALGVRAVELVGAEAGEGEGGLGEDDE